ncbi:MAG: dUTP diphosphatase [Ilumatobacter sp.]|uniref:dUTP diphosphatase n=1 Tax=Ilumatobacter sp. TaxID=1967498 RepID=UPI0026365D62|nr:dUTP diphosphatase [Ilumatobacter sp.]MDJ0770464.1 dUTP diphosphatase [Ilumatobacter sp.]
MTQVRIVRLHPDARLPRPAHQGDAGADLCSVAEIELAAAGGRALVPTGLAIELPPAMVAYVMPRSGLALRDGVTCLNAPGVIDSGYRGEIGVVLVNTDPTEDFVVRPGDRIAQLVVAELPSVSFAEVEELGGSERGVGGFGHTGVASS